VPEPIYPVGRREDGVRSVPQVERQRLLSPTEREEARRRREEARKQRTAGRPKPAAPKDPRGGVDYSA
jgi:hypothetical protein